MISINPQVRRLTEAEKQQYREDGYVSPLPLFADDGVRVMQSRFHELRDKLPASVEMGRVNCWHKANRWVYDLSCTPALLDCVEDLLGENFYLWGAQFFCKFPSDGTVVPWHQDAQYWPLSPRKSVTAWISIFDTDIENAAMQIVRGTHRMGDFEHSEVDHAHYILPQEIDEKSIAPDRIVTLRLKAGQFSFHNDGLIHGSGPNRSNRIRAGLVLRFSPTEVKCDLAEWPNFEAYLARGHDEFQHNPQGKMPRGDGCPTDKFQHSSEFE